MDFTYITPLARDVHDLMSERAEAVLPQQALEEVVHLWDECVAFREVTYPGQTPAEQALHRLIVDGRLRQDRLEPTDSRGRPIWWAAKVREFVEPWLARIAEASESTA